MTIMINIEAFVLQAIFVTTFQSVIHVQLHNNKISHPLNPVLRCFCLFCAVKTSFGFGELDEETLDSSLSVLGCGPRGSPGSQGERMERFSRKVFVGGLPPDIDEGNCYLLDSSNCFPPFYQFIHIGFSVTTFITFMFLGHLSLMMYNMHASLFH